MRVLVTGAAGFIGSHLCERLIAGGSDVVGIDNFDPYYDESIKRDNVAQLIKHHNFELIEGDIREYFDVNPIFVKEPIDVIVHLAAKAGVRPSIENPLEYTQVNVDGTVVLLEAAKLYGVRKFIFASSSSVYGNNKKVPFNEIDNVDNPISPYAATKKAGELICYTYSNLYGIDVSVLRFFTVYGPRQRPDLAIHKFAKMIQDEEPIPVFGDGSMRRDFTYIDDIVDGIVASIEHCKGYEIFNLGESRPVRLDSLIEKIERAVGKKALINRLPQQPGDVEQTYADITKARDRLGYNPRTEIAEGLQKFVEWLNR